MSSSIKPIRPTTTITPTETEGKATALKKSVQSKIKKSRKSPVLFHRKENIELILLMLVLVFIGFTFLQANFINKEETIRYQLEQQANTDTLSGTDIGGLLNGKCPNLKTQGFYLKRSKNYANYKAVCPNLTMPLAQEQAYNNAIIKLQTVNKAMIDFETASGDTRLKVDERDSSKKQTYAERKKQRRYWFQKQGHPLAENGGVAAINQLTTDMRQRLQNPSIETAMAALAVADGDRAFPYSHTFKDNPDLKNTYERLAGDIYFLRSTNLNNKQQKPKLSKQLITPVFLLPVAFWQLAAWSLLAWFSLALSRRITKPHAFIPILLVLWLGMAYISPSITMTQRQIIVIVTIALGISILSYLPFAPTKKLLLSQQNRWELGSRLALPGFTLFIGIGLLIMIDLGGRGYLASRTEALRLLPLKHIRMIFWCFLALSVIPTINYLLGDSLSKVFNNLTQTIFSNTAKAWKKIAAVAVFLLAIAAVSAFVYSLKSKPYIVAEILKVWLVFGLALYVVSRKSKANTPSFLFSWQAIPLYIIMLVPIVLLIITTEMGTLQVFIYAAAIFLGGFYAHIAKTHYKTQSVLIGSGIALTIMIAFTVSIALFGDVIASRAGERIAMWIDPFNATNDQMAIIHWFRESTPFFGYGFGNIPWCGFNLGACAGVPYQQQSDYTATSVIAAYGKFISVCLFALFCIWIARMVAAQGKIHGHIQKVADYPVNFSHSVLAWTGICWAVVALVQTFVTVFGNLGVIPLTGVTLPFLSYGDAALLTNTVLLALMINIPTKNDPASIELTQ